MRKEVILCFIELSTVTALVLFCFVSTTVSLLTHEGIVYSILSTLLLVVYVIICPTKGEGDE